MSLSNITITHSVFESIPDCRKEVILLCIIKNDDDLIHECGFLNKEIDRLCLQFQKNIGTKWRIFDYFKNDEKANLEKILSK